MTKAPITVCMATYPQRSNLLRHAVESVRQQALEPAGGLSVSVDYNYAGAPATRTKALRGADTEWVAFLDDDDLMLSNHLSTLYDFATANDADYVFSHYLVLTPHGTLAKINATHDTAFGEPFDNENPRQTTITILAKRELVMDTGAFKRFDADGEVTGEDWRLTLDCVERGAKIMHVPVITWLYRWHGVGTATTAGNTSGRPDRRA